MYVWQKWIWMIGFYLQVYKYIWHQIVISKFSINHVSFLTENFFFIIFNIKKNISWNVKSLIIGLKKTKQISIVLYLNQYESNIVWLLHIDWYYTDYDTCTCNKSFF